MYMTHTVTHSTHSYLDTLDILSPSHLTSTLTPTTTSISTSPSTSRRYPVRLEFLQNQPRPCPSNMPPSKRRRVPDSPEAPAIEIARQATADESTAAPPLANSQIDSSSEGTTKKIALEPVSDIAEKNKERQDRFKALQARAVSRLVDLSSIPECSFSTCRWTSLSQPMC